MGPEEGGSSYISDISNTVNTHTAGLKSRINSHLVQTDLRFNKISQCSRTVSLSDHQLKLATWQNIIEVLEGCSALYSRWWSKPSEQQAACKAELFQSSTPRQWALWNISDIYYNISEPRRRYLSYTEMPHKQKQTPWPLVCKRTIPTEQPPLVGEI
jgi:hypothetical protein